MTKQRLKTLLKKVYIFGMKKRLLRLPMRMAALLIGLAVIYPSGLFDKNWYRKQHVDGRLKHLPLVHYLVLGRYRGLMPNILFSPEYFSPNHWNHQLLDPLASYILLKKNWTKATHPLFGGDLVKRDRYRPPLATYLLDKTTKRPLPLDDGMSTLFKKEVSQKKAYATISKIQDEWFIEERLRRTNMPKKSFNFRRQDKLISQYTNTKLVEDQKVSIVMPAWNRELLIEKAIGSVQNQSHTNWELIIVDDGSEDDTVKVIEEYASTDQRIRLIKNNHEGVCAARNSALESATGTYVAFLDSDNEWSKEFLETMVTYLFMNNVHAGYAATKMQEKDGVRYRDTEPNSRLLRISNFIDLNVLVVHKEVIDTVGVFDKSLRRMVDYDLILRIDASFGFEYVPIIGVNYINHDDISRISNTELVSWNGVVKSKNLVDWGAQKKKNRKNGTTIVVGIRSNIQQSIETIEGLIKNTDSTHEILLVNISAAPSISNVLASFSLIKNVRCIRIPAASDPTLAFNLAVNHIDTDKVVFIKESFIADNNWLPPLLEVVSPGTVAAPVILQENRLISSAGVVPTESGNGRLQFLHNHPVDDLLNFKESFSVPAVADGCLLIMMEDLIEQRGFNALLDSGFENVELSQRFKNKATIVTTSLFISKNKSIAWNKSGYTRSQTLLKPTTSLDGYKLWKKAGFTVVGYEKTDFGDNKEHVIRPILTKNSANKRWSIKISAPADERRFAWGDTYFAQSLADSMRKQGVQVVIDYLGAHQRNTSYLDDVVLVIRGLTKYDPEPGQINILWVISHPELVTADEVRSYDKVFSAGKKWAEYMTEQSGITVDILLQCTDATLFNSHVKNNEIYENSILFVGNSRNVYRPIVKDTIESDVDVSIYGGGWDSFIDKKYIKETLIPNTVLPEAYRSAKIVLNDHWDDMRDWGFYSNRLFDVSATGTPVVTDNIEGLDSIFEGLVRAYKDRDELKHILSDIDNIYPDEAQRNRIAKMVTDNHSFDARAKELFKQALHLQDR